MKAFIWTLLLATSAPPFCDGFSVKTVYAKRTTRREPLVVVFGIMDDGELNDGAPDDDDDDLEVQRQRLAALFGGDTSESSTVQQQPTSNSVLPPDWEDQLARPPCLTAIGRERAQAEIDLLQKLEESDEPTNELWQLWYNSRGPECAKALEATDELLGQGPSGWLEAEKKLRDLVAREGIYFVEAVNRLATVLYLLKRFKESKQACEIVLAVKPWHFGALSGIVGVCHGLGDRECMIDWAKERMPPLESKLTFFMGAGVSGETRAEWVDRMVEQAQSRLTLAEKGVQSSFQHLDDDDGNGSGNTAAGGEVRPIQVEEEDAWQ